LARKVKLGGFTVAACCVILPSIWLGGDFLTNQPSGDYETCSENAEAKATSKKERADLLNQCGIQFVGRRKLDGGYMYHDFMQNRNFDIAGPNPTPEELKRIDEEYIDYLDVQRREAIAGAFAKKQTEVEKTESEVDRTGNVGPPMVITPMNQPTPEIKDSLAGRNPTVVSMDRSHAVGQNCQLELGKPSNRPPGRSARKKALAA
jgi:hypothetical protein